MSTESDESLSDELEGRSLIEYIDTHLDQTMERLERGAAPIWDAQADMGRTIITLSSGAIVLSVSVTQLFMGKVTGLEWTWLLPAAWILFALSVLVGISRQGWMGSARAVRAFFEQKRSEIRAALWALPPGPDLGDRVDQVLDKAMTDASTEPGKALKVYNVLNQIAFWAFAAGLGALVAFAIKNLPL